MKHQEGARVNAGYAYTRCQLCGGKWCYVSRKAARKGRQRMAKGATKGAELSPYRCPYGNGWHVGHLHDKRAGGRDRLRAAREAGHPVVADDAPLPSRDVLQQAESRAG